MYERCISTWSSTGSIRPPSGPGLSVGVSVTEVLSQVSDVEETDVFGVALDERPPLLDVLAHQDRENLGGLGRVLAGHLEPQPVVGVDRGVPQLAPVHLPEPLVALDGVLLRQL